MSGDVSRPAGWYPDPHDATVQRWWDGTDWTEHTSPTAPAPTSSATSSAPSGGPPESDGTTLGSGPFPRLPVAKASIEDPQLRANLAAYDTHGEHTCLTCGYAGAMGAVSIQRPWYWTWWLFVPLLLTGVGVLFIVLLMIMGRMDTRVELECPNCGAHHHLRGMAVVDPRFGGL